MPGKGNPGNRGSNLWDYRFPAVETENLLPGSQTAGVSLVLRRRFASTIIRRREYWNPRGEVPEHSRMVAFLFSTTMMMRSTMPLARPSVSTPSSMRRSGWSALYRRRLFVKRRKTIGNRKMASIARSSQVGPISSLGGRNA